MEKLQLNLQNCYGIKKMNEEIDFYDTNVSIIYAPNGTMKSSLANTFRDIRDGKKVEEKIFGNESIYRITDECNNQINNANIIVINTFDEKLFENQGLLMANEKLRQQYLKIYKDIETKKDNLYIQIKKQLGYSTRSIFDVKTNMLMDWKKTKKEEYECLKEIYENLHMPQMNCVLKNDELDYNVLFNDKVYGMIKDDKTSELIGEYEKKYIELVNNSIYMQNGIIDHNNYNNIGDTLDKNGFFKAKNEIILNSKNSDEKISLKSKSELNKLVKREKEKVLNTGEIKELFEKINTMITKNRDTQAFNTFLQSHQDIILEYKDVELFKKKVWIKAFSNYEISLKEVLDDYQNAKKELKQLRKLAAQETTEWKEALDLFLKRFYVPFTIKTSNQDDVILNMEMPSFKYIFKDSSGEQEVTKESLLEVLSTGEKRAYYILNMIFQILVAKKEKRETLIVLDDISESFDYRNKYAIIEYISDISQYVDDDKNPLFKILLLTHNFDFYRTVATRIARRGNSFIAFSDLGEIKFEKGQYTKNIFNYFKDKVTGSNPDDAVIVASIPFVRNLIEYTKDDRDRDYLLLTNILHYKDDTKNITLEQIQNIFNDNWCTSKKATFANGREDEKLISIIMKEADNIDDVERIDIKNKIILSMAIRLKAEIYMIDKIKMLSDGEEIVKDIYNKSNQTRYLLKAYKEHINDKYVKNLELVAMITPENIHLNSFMFEPILDMSLKSLHDLYYEIKNMALY